MATRKKKQQEPYWKEPAVIAAVVIGIAILAGAISTMLHFSKPQPRPRKNLVSTRLEPSPMIQIEEKEINLDDLDVQAYTELLAQVGDGPDILDGIELALVQSLHDGRGKASIPSLPSLEHSAITYPPRLVHRLEELATLGGMRGKLRPSACMELGLFEYYREKDARLGTQAENVTTRAFGDLYAALGLKGQSQNGYNAAAFFFTRAIKGYEPGDNWMAANIRRGTALADIGLIFWAWRDRPAALQLLEEAQAVFLSQHNAPGMDMTRKYLNALLAEGPIQDSAPSPAVAEIRNKLAPPQNMP